MRRFLGVLILALSSTLAAQADKVDRLVHSTILSLHFPGVSLAVVHHGRLVKAKGYGLANFETQSAATSKTVYEIGSMTKQFTAVAVMMLVEEGRLGLEDPLTRYFPDAPDWWARITIRHVLTHTSGIQNHVAVPGYLSAFKSTLFFEDTPSRDELLHMFYRLPKEFEPGETWAYDNTGYYLLGIILEKVSGQGYYDLLENRIFRPLSMTATRRTDARPVVPGRAAGYEWVRDHWENRRSLPPAVGFAAGAILSTVEDLARWDQALRSQTLLKRSRLEQMWTPATANEGRRAAFDYGFGWFVESYAGRRDIHHGGGTPGFSSSMHRFVGDDLTVILLTNYGDRILDHLALEIAGIYEPRLRARLRSGADPQLTAQHRRILADLVEERSDLVRFTEPMRLHLGTATGKGFLKWYAAHGDLNSFTPLVIGNTEEPGTFRYGVGLGAGVYRFSFKLTEDGQIAQIHPW